ncbi:hypothetical protein PSA7680_02748 [Pseudoruegeria aquimaris]|uniref:Uncharacterized protein n=1 Tax=Pseudoruegeria aquimaris TaxID=393663 RepID=A0A1Y5SZR1_9RHOB|nr:hypothetical protein [Pseudoruegeria aquimaris]SLN52450.1 hypothetical protein PSA7680_02748 [Pseudoruegeria aquimaris]
MLIPFPQPENQRDNGSERQGASASRDDILSLVLQFALPGDFSAERLMDRFDTGVTRK